MSGYCSRFGRPQLAGLERPVGDPARTVVGTPGLTKVIVTNSSRLWLSTNQNMLLVHTRELRDSGRPNVIGFPPRLRLCV